MSARADILAAIGRANLGRPGPVQEDHAYRRGGETAASGLAERFLERLRDYDVGVTEIDGEDIAGAVGERLNACGVSRIVAPRDLPRAWRPDGVDIVDEFGLDARALDQIPAALTGCALAIAETGTIVLDAGPTQGRRALTLLPDHHLCIVFAHQLVGSVPEALQALRAPAGAGQPLTLLSGPSATADIEFDRVVGVHGPRRLDVLFVRSPDQPAKVGEAGRAR